jgi:hypothetical protein
MVKILTARFLVVCTLVCLLTPGSFVSKADDGLQEVPLDSDRWQIQADQSRVEQHLGRSSLYLKDGIAWVKDSEFTDGVLEFDIAFTGQRGFMGMVWRLQDEGNY